jgi:bromodomain adjacent to zinc finger domain protein 1A
MPLLKKKPFERLKPPPGLKPDDEVFFCEATGEVFAEYEPFFERTILCNSLVWTCAITGKSSLTFEDALESEKKARKRLGSIPKQLKKALLYLTSRTKRGRITDLVDDVYVFACNRFFTGEHVEGVINDQWCDCKIIRVVAPTEEEIAKDSEAEKQDLAKEAAEATANGGSPKTKSKEKKRFFPYDHLFKYEIVEIEPDDPSSNEVSK